MYDVGGCGQYIRLRTTCELSAAQTHAHTRTNAHTLKHTHSSHFPLDHTPLSPHSSAQMPATHAGERGAASVELPDTSKRARHSDHTVHSPPSTPVSEPSDSSASTVSDEVSALPLTLPTARRSIPRSAQQASCPSFVSAT